MQPEPTLENVLLALSSLYHSSNTTEKEHASAWLQEFQKSVYAWTISDQLLARKKDLESCYFAAQTMRTKIQYHFYELPQDSYCSLRDSLLNHIAQCDNNTNHVVITQLCLALADLALLMASWKHSVKDLLHKFLPNPNSYPVLLDILALYPEEINSRALRLGKNRRTELVDELTTVFEGTHEFLMRCIRTNIGDPQKMCCNVLKCLGSWFKCGAVPEKYVIQSDLLNVIFPVLADANSSSQLHEAATDCLCEMLLKCEDLKHYGRFSQCIFERVLSLHSAYTMCALQGNTDRCLNFARIFTEMAESFVDCMIQCPNQGLGSFAQLEVVCSTLDNDEYEVAEISFNFWYTLSEKIYQIDDKVLSAHFSPYVQKVILSLHKHVQLASDHEGLLDKSDEFYDFRVRAGELIKDLIFIVGSANCFTEMYKILTTTQISSWSVIEAALFVLAAVARSIPPEVEGVVPHVLEAIFTQYCTTPAKVHISLSFTSITLIGELSEWLRFHSDSLDSALQFILSSLHEPELCNVAASALEQICVECCSVPHLQRSIETLLEVVRAIDSFKINVDATVRLVKGVSLIMSKFPNEQLAHGIRQLCSFQIEPLKMLLTSASNSTHELTKKKGNDPARWVDRLTSVVRYGIPQVKNGYHPCFQVIADIWPVISQFCDKYQADGKLIEKCCRCIRFAIRNLGTSFTPLLNLLVTQMITLYPAHHHSCFLYLGAILVDEYGSEKGCQEGLLNMTRALAKPTFELLGKADGLRHHPDTVDDFFRLMVRFLQKDRSLLLGSGISKPLLKCAIAATVLEHREANASVMKFFMEFLDVPDTSQTVTGDDLMKQKQVSDLLAEDGQALVNALIHCCVSALPSYLMLDVAEVTLGLLTFDRNLTSQWFHTSLSNLPTTGAGGAVTATQEQLTDFHSGISRAKEIQDLVHLYKDLLQLYR